MNPIFSFQRVKLLAIRYCTEHGRRDLITLSTMFIAFALLPRLNDPSDSFNPMLFSVILFLGGMRLTARVFHEIHQPASGMHYLHIPASRLEKFLLNGIFTLLLYPALCLLLYYGGVLFGNLIEPIMPSFFNYRVIDISSLIPETYIYKLISQYLLLQAIFFLGSLIFKKHPTTKTFLSIIAFGIVVALLQSLLIKILWMNLEVTPTGTVEMKLKQLFESLLDSRIVSHINYLFNGIVAIFFWVVSYLKFTEKQV